MPLSSRQKLLLKQIVWSSHLTAAAIFTPIFLACCATCYFAGIRESLLDIVVVVLLMTAFRLSSTPNSRQKAFTYREGDARGAKIFAALIEISQEMSIEVPKLYLYVSKHLNAVCTFDNNFRYSLTVCEGFDKTSEVERKAVLTHELGHVKCRHSLWMLAGTMLIALFLISSFSLPVALDIPAYALSPFSAMVTVGFALLLVRLARLQELQADAISTVLGSKNGLIENLVDARIPTLAALTNHFHPEHAEEDLEREYRARPDRLELVLKLDSAINADAAQRSKLNLLKARLFDAHPPLEQRLKNMERYEALLAV